MSVAHNQTNITLHAFTSGVDGVYNGYKKFLETEFYNLEDLESGANRVAKTIDLVKQYRVYVSENFSDLESGEHKEKIKSADNIFNNICYEFIGFLKGINATEKILGKIK